MPNSTEKPGKPIADVSPADSVASSATSKSIIITNHPVMKDPMVLPDKVVGTDSTPANTAVRLPTKITLQPIHANVVPDTPSVFDKVAEPTAPPEGASNEASDQPGAAVRQPPQGADDATQTTTQTDDYHDGLNEQPISQESDAKLLELNSEAEIAKRASLDALIASKKYFLRINASEKRRSQQSLIIGIILVSILGAAWINIALDAGIIELGNLKPITHFFK
jgi:hypothetical protein